MANQMKTADSGSQVYRIDLSMNNLKNRNVGKADDLRSEHGT